MDLDQKIDYLTDNIIALSGQTEKRAKNAELLISQAFQELNTATTNLNHSADTIKQTAAEEVHRGLNQSVDKFTERMETSGRWLLENSREIEKQQQQSAKIFGNSINHSILPNCSIMFRYNSLFYSTG